MKTTKKKTYKGQNGYGITLGKKVFTLKITYPASYEGVCLGMGGTRKHQTSSKVDQFFEGKIPFYKATDLYNPKKEKMAHFMRIR